MKPERTFSGTSPVQLRRDIPVEEALAYWRGPHARLVSGGSGWREYRQHLFVPGTEGIWPATPGVETRIPADAHMDGAAELTFKDALGPLRGAPTHLRILADEEHAFSRTLMYWTLPGGGRWHLGSEVEVLERRVVLIRQRPDVERRAFAAFVHERLAGQLAAFPQITELRSAVFFPLSEKLWPTFRVSHRNPSGGRFAASVIIGGTQLEQVLKHDQFADVAVSHFCEAIHAYPVLSTFPCVIEGEDLLPPPDH